MTKHCQCCGGSGQEIDHKSVGVEMRALRLKANFTQEAVAKEMGYTGAYICDLEKGRRYWTPALIEIYKRACKT